MPLADPRQFMSAARTARYGVGAFNATLLEHAEAIVAGAESAGAPVVLQISQNAVNYHGALEPIAVAALALARASRVPVAVHLDHTQDVSLIEQAVRLGMTSVMFDASQLPYDENVQETAKIVAFCHAHVVAVEAELGEIGGKDGVHTSGVRTDPQEALRFCEATGVDALAVAVGTSHAMASRDAVVDIALVSQLAEVVPVPLVLHGSSGVDDVTMSRVVRAGMTKVNIATHLNKVFTAAVRSALHDQISVVDARRYVAPAREQMAVEVRRLLGVLGAVGRA